MLDWAEYVKFLVALVAILDIPGNAPMYLQRTAEMNLGARLIVALSAAICTGAVLLGFAYFGEVLLEAFGITIEAFKILGGIVILLIALEMLGLRSPEPVENGAVDGGPVAVGVFPLAVPLFAGPGAITAVMVYTHEDFHSNHDLIIIALIIGAAIIIAAGLALVAFFGGAIGPMAQNVANRLLGMIVGALGVEFILEGAADFFTKFVST